MSPLRSVALPRDRPAAPGTPRAAAVDAASADHLLAHLLDIDRRVRVQVAARRAVDPEPDDAFRGLYLSDDHVDALLARGTPAPAGTGGRHDRNPAVVDADRAAAAALDAGRDVRLARLARAFDLDAMEVDVLLLAALPDLDPRVEQLYGYLNDDVSKRRLTVRLALELCGASPLDSRARAVFDPTSSLLAAGLVVRQDDDAGVLGRSLQVPDRVTAHLLGDDRLPEELAAIAADVADVDVAVPGLVRALGPTSALVYLRGGRGSASAPAARGALAAVGPPPLCLDLTTPGASVDGAVIASAVRDARLRGTGLVVLGFDELAAADLRAARALADAPVRVVAAGASAWDPRWSSAVPLVREAPVLSAEARGDLWRRSLPASGALADPIPAVASFALAPEQITGAARAASVIADAEGRPPAPTDLQAGARQQNAAGLERLARRLRPVAGWGDVVLPDPVIGQLREIAARGRHRTTVLGTYGLGRKASAGGGVAALFAGPSGTGKTLGAEVIAGALGLDLYVIDLSSVVDKYIGETEKNLDRVFAQAEQVNGVLLFDEADALFGKRSDVSDARDRYANVEVAYLLQRMEAFDGLAVLTTNLRSNIDEAFLRRLDAVVDFPKPDVEERRRLWQLNLPAAVPRAPDIDLDFLATTFPLTGGEIRNACVTAAYLAVDEDRTVAMADLVRGTAREYRKLGRMCVPAEFGPWYAVLEGT